MCIERVACADLSDEWSAHPCDRYLPHPAQRTAFVQLIAEPGAVYVLYDEPLPASFMEALAAINMWRMTDGQAAA
jgi:hypothetical protein